MSRSKSVRLGRPVSFTKWRADTRLVAKFTLLGNAISAINALPSDTHVVEELIAKLGIFLMMFKSDRRREKVIVVLSSPETRDPP